MTKSKKDWNGIAAVVAGGVFTAAVYVLGMVALFGPMAHAVTHWA